MTNIITVQTLIIGAGPAGVQCAITLDNQNISTAIVNKAPMAGGLLCISPFICSWIATNYKHTGIELAATIEQNLQAHPNLHYLPNNQVTEVTETKQGYFIAKTQNATIHAHYIVLAMGSAPRTGGLTESESILIGPGKKIVDYDFIDKKVAILGGGDNAFENCHFIADKKASVVDIYAKKIIARADIQKLVPLNRITIGLADINPQAMTVNGILYDVICVFYGWQPQIIESLNLKTPLNQTLKGNYSVNNFCQTNHPNIYAIGEINANPYPSIVQSLSEGMLVGKEIGQRSV